MFKKYFQFAILVGALFLAPVPANAADGLTEKDREEKALRIRSGFGIYIDDYVKDADAYIVRIESEPDVGPNVTTLEWLLKGIANGMSEKDLRKTPRRLVGSYFRLKQTLWLLSEDEINARKNNNKKKNTKKSAN